MGKLRLAGLIAALSQVTDLGMGQPPESAVRACLLAHGLARRMGVDDEVASDIYYTTLLQHVGCTAYAHETASLFGGDDIAVRAGGAQVDFGNTKEALTFLLTGIAGNAAFPTRVRAVFNGLRLGAAFDEALSRANCDVAVHIARRLILRPGVQDGLNHIYERWDGKGQPHKLKGEDIALPARFAQVASQTVLFHQLGGWEFAAGTIVRWAHGALDPTIAGTLAEHGGAILAEIDAIDATAAVIDAEPQPHLHIAPADLDRVARAFGDMVDLKSPFTHGHSAGVAALTESAAGRLELSRDDVDCVRRAAWLHDLGRVAVPTGIWDKPGPLTSLEWDQVRLHPYYSERILLRSPVLAPMAPLAAMHHERNDGSGYFRQCKTAMIPAGARLLAAADAYQAMTQDRPYRPALSPEQASAQLRSDVTAGRLDPDAVQAVLDAAGHTGGRGQRAHVAGLTGREIEVLRLAARGHSNREIGRMLSISPKTADHHIQHIYTKIGVSTRAGAAIFAMEHDLISNEYAAEMG